MFSIFKKKEEKPSYESWLTCFVKTTVTDYSGWGSRESYEGSRKIKYSGKKVTVPKNKTLYECYDGESVVWLDKEHLLFPY